MPEPTSRSWHRDSSTARSRGARGCRAAERPNPVDTTTACRATRSVTVPSSAVTRTRLTPVNSACPRTRSMPVFSSHRTCDASSQSWVMTIAAAQHAGDVEVPGDRLLRAVEIPGRSQGRRAAQQPLGRHAGPVRALAAHQLGLDDDGGHPALHGAIGDVLAHGPGSDHDDVVFAFAHPFTVSAAAGAGSDRAQNAALRRWRASTPDADGRTRGWWSGDRSRRTGTNRFLDPPPGSRHEELR